VAEGDEGLSALLASRHAHRAARARLPELAEPEREPAPEEQA